MTYALETLGIAWDESTRTYTAGESMEPMHRVDLIELYNDIVAWRGTDIEGDREALSDWETFVTAVKEAKHERNRG